LTGGPAGKLASLSLDVAGEESLDAAPALAGNRVMSSSSNCASSSAPPV